MIFHIKFAFILIRPEFQLRPRRGSAHMIAEGLDMSSAVNIFLRQFIMRGGLPFKFEVPQYSKELLSAADEAKCISRDNDVPVYTSMEDLKKALEAFFRSETVDFDDGLTEEDVFAKLDAALKDVLSKQDEFLKKMRLSDNLLQQIETVKNSAQ